MRRRVMQAVACLALLVSGCDDDSTKKESTRSLVRSWVTEVNKQVGIWCECKNALGFSDTVQCENATGYVFASDERCYLEAFERDATGSETYLECLVAVNRAQRKCLYAALRCNNLDSADACEQTFQEDVLTCGELPIRVTDALSDCPSVIIGPSR